MGRGPVAGLLAAATTTTLPGAGHPGDVVTWEEVEEGADR